MQIRHDIPWHKPAWHQLGQSIRSQRLPHALLLTGPAGVGKQVFADRLQQLLLCRSPDLEALKNCGQCDACNKTRTGSHPDFRRVSPAEGKREIIVDDIRNLLKFIQLSPQVAGGYKVACIAPADAMNRNAANALLKTLEEPPAGRLIVLNTDSVGRIPATIRSRCRILRFAQPSNEQALAWLSEESGAKFDPSLLERHDYSVLRALASQQQDEQCSEQNPGDRESQWRQQWLAAANRQQAALKVAEQWANTDEQLAIVHWLLRENIRATRNRLGIGGNGDQDIFVQLGLELPGILEIHNKVNELVRLLETTLNARLLWETFLLDCHRIASETSA